MKWIVSLFGQLSGRQKSAALLLGVLVILTWLAVCLVVTGIIGPL